MKKFLLVVMMLACVVVSGCRTAITPDDMKALSGQIESLTQQVEVYQKAIDDVAASAKVTGIITPEQKAMVDDYQAKINVAKPIIVAANAAVKNAEYDPNGDTIKTLLTALRAVNGATAGVNPYSGVIEAILALITLLTGLFALKKNADAKTATDTAATATDEAAVATAKYQAHKQGVELTMKQVSASTVPEVKAIETQLYTNIGAARTANGVAA